MLSYLVIATEALVEAARLWGAQLELDKRVRDEGGWSRSWGTSWFALGLDILVL